MIKKTRGTRFLWIGIVVSVCLFSFSGFAEAAKSSSSGEMAGSLDRSLFLSQKIEKASLETLEDCDVMLDKIRILKIWARRYGGSGKA